MNAILISCQIIIGFGILNVWLLRANRKTGYRGGEATSLKEEFAAYGIPEWMFWVIGTLKVTTALALLAGVFYPILVVPAAAVMATLMLGAVVMHLKVKDPARKFLPAICLLVLSLLLVFA